MESPNAYSDDDQSPYQGALNALPYYGAHICFGSPFNIIPSEKVSREEFACMLVRSILAGTTENLTGKEDKYSDDGASKWTSNINVLAANNVIPACSSVSDKFCPTRKISIGEVSYIIDQMVSKSHLFRLIFLIILHIEVDGVQDLGKLKMLLKLQYLILMLVMTPVFQKIIQI